MPIFKYGKKDSRRKVLEPGEYEVIIDSADIRTSSNGNEMIVLSLKTTEEETLINDRIVFAPKTHWKVRQFLDCFDLGPETDDEEAEINISNEFIDDLVGKIGDVQIDIETFNGIKRNKVLNYLEPEEDEEDDD
jgi:hypothetical protein